MGSVSSSSQLFTGGSAFSAQLAQVIQTAVAQASAPITQLQSQQTAFTGQQSELSTLTSKFQSLQTAIDSINAATGTGAYAATSSDGTVAQASTSAGVMAGSYSVTVGSLGSETNTMSGSGLTLVTDPFSGNIDSSSTYTLAVNGQNYQITDSGGTLNGLAEAINASGANVEATVVNVGSPSSPDYRLSVQSNEYAPDTIQVTDSGNTQLLNTLTTGSYVTYQVNGQPSTPVNATTRTVTISPGLAVTFTGAGTADIAVAQNATGISAALNSFVSAYNSAAQELTKNRGQNGGALSGDSVVYELQGALRNVVNYIAPSGNVNGLAGIGLSFDLNGNLQFDQTTFNQASASDVLSFFGSETGGGFLQNAESLMTSVTDATTGVLPQATQSITSEMSDIAAKISGDQSNVSQLQQTLTQQMAAADAAISSLEQQLNEITGLFNAEQTQTMQARGL
ncbi:MAG: flagellar filament capping protein FliD [Bryobacteraceae bacterium]